MANFLPLLYVPVLFIGNGTARFHRGGSVYPNASTAKGMVTRSIGRGAVGGEVRVLDANGAQTLGVVDLQAQRDEAERLMLHWCSVYEKLKRQIDGTVGAELGDLYARVAGGTE